MVWCCWPRLDGDPIFCALIDGDKRERGLFAIALDEPSTAVQSYERNTAILRTVVTSESGSFAITDFAPLFLVSGRMHRPPMIIRRIEPLSGLPRVRAILRPMRDYGARKPTMLQGSNHISFVSEGGAFRVTTNAPISYVVNGGGFVLTRPLTFILHADETLPDAVDRIGSRFRGAHAANTGSAGCARSTCRSTGRRR